MKNEIAFFVDISNLFYCIGKRFVGKKIDYEKLLTRASEFGSLRRAIAYGTQIEDEAKNFITCLKRLGYDTKYKQAKTIEIEEKKFIKYTSWSVGIAMDVVRIVPRIDTVIIGSADSELAPLVQWIKDQGVKTIVLACGISRELKEIADSYIEINESLLETEKEVVNA